jgi:hypothetical protein
LFQYLSLVVRGIYDEIREQGFLLTNQELGFRRQGSVVWETESELEDGTIWFREQCPLELTFVGFLIEYHWGDSI